MSQLQKPQEKPEGEDQMMVYEEVKQKENLNVNIVPIGKKVISKNKNQKLCLWCNKYVQNAWKHRKQVHRGQGHQAVYYNKRESEYLPKRKFVRMNETDYCRVCGFYFDKRHLWEHVLRIHKDYQSRDLMARSYGYKGVKGPWEEIKKRMIRRKPNKATVVRGTVGNANQQARSESSEGLSDDTEEAGYTAGDETLSSTKDQEKELREMVASMKLTESSNAAVKIITQTGILRKEMLGISTAPVSRSDSMVEPFDELDVIFTPQSSPTHGMETIFKLPVAQRSFGNM